MKRILVIDDDEALRRTVSASLRKSGYEPLEADCGEQGLETARRELPDLVLSDVNMGELDGFELLQNLRSQPVTSAIPVILMTGQPSKADLRLGMERGADDYLPKPFDMAALLAVVKVRLERHQNIVAQAKSNEERLLEVLAATQDLVAITEASSGHLLYLNRAGRKMLGVGENEDIGRLSLADFHAEGVSDESHTEQSTRAEGHGIWVGESAYRSRDGRHIPVSQQILAHGLAAGENAYMSVVARDITERLAAEQALRDSETRYRNLIESQGEGFVTTDTEQRFTLANPAAEHILGVPRGYLLGRKLQEFVSEKDAALIGSQLELRRAGKKSSYEVEIMAADGVRRQILITAAPVIDEPGRFTGTNAVFRDITERKQADQDRQTMEVQLRQAQKLEAIGQLAAGIAHEINTPTQYVGDNTRFLQDSFNSLQQVLKIYGEIVNAARANALIPDLIARADQASAAADLDYLFEQIPAAINETLEGVGRISKIVRAMKEFSHPGGEERTSADLNKAIESTVTVARNEWKYVADMNLDLDPQLPGVPCFLGEFNQAILNLVVNAAHAIGDVVKQAPGTKGAISISTRRTADHVEIRVADTGTGIPDSARPKIFEPFFTTKPVGRGTGQGLSIVYGSIVKKHGGTVRFETEVGKGTTFIIRLPLNSRADPGAPKAGAEAQAAHHSEAAIA